MKKYFLSFGLLLIVSLTTVVFNSCEKDNDIEKPIEKKDFPLKVSFGNALPGAKPDQFYTQTLTKDTLSKIFADSNIRKIKIEIISADDMSELSDVHFARAVDSLIQAKDLYGDKIVIENTVLFIANGFMDGVSQETLQKLQTLGITLQEIVLAQTNAILRKRKLA